MILPLTLRHKVSNTLKVFLKLWSSVILQVVRGGMQAISEKKKKHC
jgi:hypothetical protein